MDKAAIQAEIRERDARVKFANENPNNQAAQEWARSQQNFVTKLLQT